MCEAVVIAGVLMNPPRVEASAPQLAWWVNPSCFMVLVLAYTQIPPRSFR
jgi:hypothetical protein